MKTEVARIDNYLLTIGDKSIVCIECGELQLNLKNSIWIIEVKGENESSKAYTVDDMETFESQAAENKLRLRWEGCGINVIAEIFAEEEKLKWSISVSSKKFGLNKIIYPVLGGIEPISKGGEEDYFVLPLLNGWLIKDPVHNLFKNEEMPFWLGKGGLKYENEYPAQYTCQLFAHYSPNKYGVYFSVEDGKAYIKTVGFHTTPGCESFDFMLINYPENMGTIRYYTMPYVFTLCFFEGDWQTAANLYRSWAIKQKWCHKLKDKEIPSLVKEIDFFRINHENYNLGKRTEEYVKTCNMIQDGLNAKVAMHWYGWNMAEKHGDYYPEMFKPGNQDWPSKLIEYNRTLSDNGISKIPFVNAHLWDSRLTSWEKEKVAELTIKAENMAVQSEPWTDFLSPVCHSAPAVLNKALDVMTKLITAYGFDGIYVDQVAASNATLCFDKTHPHPIGGGNWWNCEYHKQIETLRSFIGSEKILTTESCCESYQDVFDLFLILDTTSAEIANVFGIESSESIPLFALIYGDCALSYGSTCRLTDPIDLFEFYFVRNLLWGIIPTAEGMELSEIENAPEHWAVLKKGVEFYKNNKEDILFGRLSHIPDYKCEKTVIIGEIRGISIRKEIPYVMSAIWEHNKSRSVFSYNLDTKTQSVEVCGKSFKVPPKSFLKLDIS